ncbi:hypothetical protein [Rhizobium leucaenae]|uniref:Uncharacterized protein n=1 Tax=Rhizobium leucaenae TaxID=29450 RepID=A0A7W7A0K4_9HYPH|nr:hypothetical protein [Rhizobium leucaenae]MBB4571737.1 hypothetical protein [Rhizobium leucaenae]
MASAKQACQALDDALRLPPNTAAGYAHRIRAQGLIPATQGKPEQISSAEIAAILIAVVTSSATVAEYLDLHAISGGATFRETLARFIDKPYDLLDLRIDTVAPGAVLTFRGHDHGVQTKVFTSDAPTTRPAFQREVRVTPDVLISLHAAVAAAPEVRAGRPPTRDRYRRYERATIF